MLEKKGHFYGFFGKTTQFFLKTERLFIFTCLKVFYEFFQKKIFITGVTIAIMPKHNFPDISRDSLYLHALSERRIFNFKQNFFFSCCKNRKLRRSKIKLFRKTITIFVKKLILQNSSFTQSVKVQTTVFFCFVYFR